MPDVPAPIPPEKPTNGKAERPTPRAQLLVTLLSDGTVNVQGPVSDLILCHGLLGVAARTLNDNAAKSEGARLVSAIPADALRVLRDH